ncbi:MAG: crotonobetainyl-CoA:carnitine CoA-transferase CaiB-like acyl-CoA transferase [Hyphomicrobiaceae bacterium]|jgi:crotonobetainyl-CoA:carnitine CoA-transferase CaiB-like acyl-CoA transferase
MTKAAMTKSALEEVLSIRGGEQPDADELQVSGHDPVFSTQFKVGETCAAVLGGVGTAINDIHEIKTGRRQTVAIDARRAAAALRSTHYLQTQNASGEFSDAVNSRHEHMITCTQPWPTKDGRWFLPHFGLPNLQARVQKVLGCEFHPEAVGKAVAGWDALDLEAAIDEARACGGMVRSNNEWLATEHGKALAAKPIVEIIKIADGDPEPFPAGQRPLSGIRALDLTRILAGPIAARTLAENGADVLMITAEHLPQIKEHVMDTSHGKRSTFLNLKDKAGADQLRTLLRDADVFSQGYRPGEMAKMGFAPEELAKVRPGIVCLSISCFGADGPFSHRAGWEQVAQTVTGICHDGGDTNGGRPKLLPAAACDYTTGYLGAYGVLLALARRAREGGSYHVRVSLCQSGMFIHRQGKTMFDEHGMDLSANELNALRIETQTSHGPLRHLGPVLELSETKPYWERPTPKFGGNKLEWLTVPTGQVEAAK